MAIHIVKTSNAKLLEAEYTLVSGTVLGGDIEGGNIDERVTLARAHELLIEWKKILYEYEQEGGNIDALFSNGAGNEEALLNQGSSTQLESLKDKLFIATNEDPLDTWEAFTHYNLDTNLTE